MSAVVPDCLTWWAQYRDLEGSGTYDAPSLRIMGDGGRRWLEEMRTIRKGLTPAQRREHWDPVFAAHVAEVTRVVAEIDARLSEILATANNEGAAQ